jgi:hypothetical protein
VILTLIEPLFAMPPEITSFRRAISGGEALTWPRSR